MKNEKEIPNLVMQSDMADRWNVTRKVVNNWTKRDSRFPKPIQVVGGGRYPLYLLEDVIAFEKVKGVKVYDQN